VGATARAMKNMGLSELRLVAPRRYPHPEADAFAAGAKDLLDQAKVFDDLAAAVADLNFLVATTNRPRGVRSTVMTPKELGEAWGSLTARPGCRPGILFGTERTGLESIDLSRADMILNIPTAEEYGSLNLSQAVLVTVYELMVGSGRARQEDFSIRHESPAASGERLERLFEHMREVLTDIEFIKPQQSRHMMKSLTAIFHRAALDDREVAILRGVFSEMEHVRGRDRKRFEREWAEKSGE